MFCLLLNTSNSVALHHICLFSGQLHTVFWGVIQDELGYDHLILKANTCSIYRRACKVGGAALHFNLRQHQQSSVD